MYALMHQNQSILVFEPKLIRIENTNCKILKFFIKIEIPIRRLGELGVRS